MQIAIDGPASSGKGTVARMVAQRLGYAYIDTGAMYRAVAHAAEQQGVSWDDGAALGQVAAGLSFGFRWDGASLRVLVNGEDVSDTIRSAELGQGASRVSVFPEVRTALLERQRELARDGRVVMEGRDIGTVVLPDARLKVFLEASLEARAVRRADEFRRKGQGDVQTAEVMAELRERDARDRGRSVAPLRQAADARLLDTTALSAAQAADVIVSWAREIG